jgi:GntR family transcriptional regulator, transcriptional repressor for pyruvate dehydrogenase complex
VRVAENVVEAFQSSGRRSVSMVPHDVAARIQNQILEGELKPGERLPPQRALSEGFGVSRASLREALSVLETLGLIDIRPGLGVFVSTHASTPRLGRMLDHGSARDVYEARLGLEGMAAILAAERIDEKDLSALREHVEAMENALGRQDLVAMAVSDAAFHDVIARASGNPLIAALYLSARDAMEQTQRAPMAARTTLAETVLEHQAVLEALERHAPLAAGEAMRAHIRGSARRLGIPLTPHG